MSLLVIAIVFVAVHLLKAQWLGSKQFLFYHYWRLFLTVISQRLSALWALALGLIVLPLMMGSIQFFYLRQGPALAWFIYSTIALALAWGSSELDRDVRRYLKAETDDDRDLAAAALTSTYRQPQPQHGCQAIIQGIFYQGLVRWFGVIFWFMLLGGAGAILFRLAHALLSTSASRDLLQAKQRDLARKVVAWLDVIPAALTTVALAMVGDFDRTLSACKRYFLEQRRSALTWDYEFLPAVGCQTIMQEDHPHEPFEHDYPDALAKIDQAMHLVWRILICWLTVISILILAGLTI